MMEWNSDQSHCIPGTTHLTSRSMQKMLLAMEAAPSPAECSRREPHPPSSPTIICMGYEQAFSSPSNSMVYVVSWSVGEMAL